MKNEPRTTSSEPRTDMKVWSFDRRVNLSVLVQLVTLAVLIIGSWANLQRQIGLLQRDVTMLLESHRDLQRRLDSLSASSLLHEYRLQGIERKVVGTGAGGGGF